MVVDFDKVDSDFGRFRMPARNSSDKVARPTPWRFHKNAADFEPFTIQGFACIQSFHDLVDVFALEENLVKRINTLTEKLQETNGMSLADFSTEEQIRRNLGVVDRAAFFALLRSIEAIAPASRPGARVFDSETELVLTLVILKRGLPQEYVGILFKV